MAEQRATAAAVCWIDGQLMAARDASLSVLDHGLLYGDGVFEGIRFYHGRPFRLAEHLRRLEDSARAIALDVPLEQAALEQAVNETIAAFAGDSGYLRLVVTRGPGPLGLDPAPCQQPTLLIVAQELELVGVEARAHGIRLVTASTRRLASDGIDPRIKSLNYLNNILARIEANTAGADEALLLNAAGRIAEGSADNVFAVCRDGLITPPVSEGALDGITRRLLIDLATAVGIEVVERPMATYDLYTARECFLTGTGAELIPVAEIDGRRLPAIPGPVFTELQRRFRQTITEECQT